MFFFFFDPNIKELSVKSMLTKKIIPTKFNKIFKTDTHTEYLIR